MTRARGFLFQLTILDSMVIERYLSDEHTRTGKPVTGTLLFRDYCYDSSANSHFLRRVRQKKNAEWGGVATVNKSPHAGGLPV